MAHPQLAWRHAATTKMLDVARLPRFTIRCSAQGCSPFVQICSIRTRLLHMAAGGRDPY